MKITRTVGVATLAGSLLVRLLPATTAQAAAIRITKVYYDSPGKDTRSRSSLDDEWVRIKNFSHHKRNLKGWTLRDRDHHVYHFGTVKLRAGHSLKIRTGSGGDTQRNLYWGWATTSGTTTATGRRCAGRQAPRWTGAVGAVARGVRVLLGTGPVPRHVY